MKQILLSTVCIFALSISASANAAVELTKEPTSVLTTATDGYKLGNDYQILNAQGQIAAKYNPTTGQFTSVTGAPIGVTTKEYSYFKAAVSQASGTKALTTKVDTQVQSAENKAVADVNSAIREIGGGFSVNSKGVITSTGTNDPVAMVDSLGNVVPLNDKKLEASTQSLLNKLMKGISLPSGFGVNDRVDPRIIQKNTYVAASDDGNVYYGDVGFNKIDVGAVVGAVVKAATDKSPTTTTTASKGYTSIPGSNQVLSATGQIVATLNPTTGVILRANGETITPNSPDYTDIKQALATAGTVATSPVVSSTPTTTTSDFKLLAGSNQITNPNGEIVATYNPTTGQFTNTNGVVLGTDNVMYQAYKQAVTASTTQARL